MTTCGGVEVKLPALLSSELDAGEMSASLPGIFSQGEEPRIHWIGVCKTHIRLDTAAKRKIMFLSGVEPRSANPHLVRTALLMELNRRRMSLHVTNNSVMKQSW
jgi:hypothetical protein